MISIYNLYDISYAFVLLRNNIEFELNIKILEVIVELLEEPKVLSKDNIVRERLSEIRDIDFVTWNFVTYNNLYVHHKFIQKYEIFSKLVYVCKYIKILLDSNCFEEAYLLLDAIHSVPIIISEKNEKLANRYFSRQMRCCKKELAPNFNIRKYRDNFVVK